MSAPAAASEPSSPSSTDLLTRRSPADGEPSSLDVVEYDERDESIDLTNIRLTAIPDLSQCHRLTSLTLRSNFIADCHLLSSDYRSLTELDLYENKLHRLSECEFPRSLTSLDLSFNHVRVIENLDSMTNLTDLFFVHNKITNISGLDALPSLRQLELGSNRLRKIDGVSKLAKLTHLWLGRNKITTIENLDQLRSLAVLSMPSNRLTQCSGLSSLSLTLTELYLSHNCIEDLTPIQSLIKLRVLDLTANIVKDVSPLGGMAMMEELWLGENALSDWQCLELFRSSMPQLTCIYLERNPIARDEPNYRAKVKAALPQLLQLDADQF